MPTYASGYTKNVKPINTGSVSHAQNPGFIQGLFTGTNLYRTLISIGEIGLSLIPGIGEVLAPTLIALTAAGAQTAVDVESGDGFSWINTFTNFASAVVPAGSAGFKAGLRNINQAKNAALVGKRLSNITYHQPWAQAERNFLPNGKVQKIFQPNVIANKSNKLTYDALNHVGEKAGFFSNPTKVLNKFIDKPGHQLGDINFLKGSVEAHLKDLLPTVTGSGATIAGIEGIENAEQRTRRQLLDNDFTKEEVDKIFEFARINGNFGKEATELAILEYLRTLDALSIQRIIGKVRGITDDLFDVSTLAKETKTIIKGVTKKELSIARRSYKYLNSNKFYQKWVQMIQNIFSGGDMGRWIPEQGYKFLLHGETESKWLNKIPLIEKWKGLEEYADKLISKKIIYKVVKEAAEIEKRLLKGEQVFIASRYIRSIKVLHMPTKAKLGEIMFTFKKKNIYIGKNKGGKKPIVGSCTLLDITNLAKDGSQHYWRVGKDRGWWLSRGGRAINGGLAISEDVASILGFLPIQLMRSLSSIISNLSGVIHDDAYGSYREDFIKNIDKTSKNRGVRLTAKTIVAPIASILGGNKAITRITRGYINPNRWLGRVAQQSALAELKIATHDGQDKSYSKLKVAKTWRTVATTRINSDLKRTLRVKHPNSVGRQSMNANRKLKITRGFVSGSGKIITGKRWF